MIDEKKIISATAPPTIANIAVGFDSLGMAVKGIGDIVQVRFTDDPGIHIVEIAGDQGKLPLDALKNTASAGAVKMLTDLIAAGKISADIGVAMRIEKRMHLGTGLGSSASSAAAGMMAVNELLGKPLTKKELGPYALIGESKASGSVHGDNVIPALWGGTVLVRETSPLDAIALPSIKGLIILVLHPHVEVLTSESRARLKTEISLKDHIMQSADQAAFIHALHTQDSALLKRSMNDRVIGPQRVADIPLFAIAKAVAMNHGALNYDISGSGPSSFSFFTSAEQSRKALDDLSELFHQNGIGLDAHLTSLDEEGARII